MPRLLRPCRTHRWLGVWRLAPYLDYNFRGLYQDDALLDDIQNDPKWLQSVVSLYPSLGMNIDATLLESPKEENKAA